MKLVSVFLVLSILAIALLAFATPVFALQESDPITPEQVVLVGAIASVLTFALSALATYGKVHLSRFWVNIVLFGVANLFAFTWSGVSLSPFPWSEPSSYWQWLNSLMLAVMPIFGVATFIYNILYTKVVVPAWSKIAKLE